MNLIIDKITITVALFNIFRLLWKFSWLYKNQKFQFEDHSIDKNVSINALMEEFKPTIMKNWEFEYRNLSKLKSLMAFSDYQDSDAMFKMHHYTIENYF